MQKRKKELPNQNMAACGDADRISAFSPINFVTTGFLCEDIAAPNLHMRRFRFDSTNSRAGFSKVTHSVTY